MDTDRNSRRLKARPRLIVALLFVLGAALFLVSCLNGGGDAGRQYGNQAELAGELFLVCSDACANRAQCGNSPEKGRVVLLSSLGPAGIRHDLSVSENTPVTAIQFRPEPASTVSGEQPLTVRYYEVAIPERGNAWVAGWCVSNQPNE